MEHVQNKSHMKLHGDKMYVSALEITGNTFQDLPRLRETTDNTERYI
jgi:hypothetical protein